MKFTQGKHEKCRSGQLKAKSLRKTPGGYITMFPALWGPPLYYDLMSREPTKANGTLVLLKSTQHWSWRSAAGSRNGARSQQALAHTLVFFFFFFFDVIFKDIARSFGGRVSGVTVEPVNVGVVDIFFLRPGALPLKHSFGR